MEIVGSGGGPERLGQVIEIYSRNNKLTCIRRENMQGDTDIHKEESRMTR